LTKPLLIRGSHGRVLFDTVAFVDTETTGLWPFGLDDKGLPSGDPDGPDRLCSLAAQLMHRINNLWIEGACRSWICDPVRSVPASAAKVNGFYRSDDGSCPVNRIQLSGQMSIVDALTEMQRFLNMIPLCFHNNVFDVAVLDAELGRGGLPPISVPVLCTKKAFSDLLGLGRSDRYVPGTNLNLLCDYLHIDRSIRVGPDGEELHGAMVDAALASRCFAILEPAGWIQVEDPGNLPHRGTISGSKLTSVTS
jgi:DNA polymerase III epsilon subunit-like protein